MRIIDQLGREILSRVDGVFASMGNVFYKPIEEINAGQFEQWEIVYEIKFNSPESLYTELEKMVEGSPYPTKTGAHYEERTGMVNFSIVGRNASPAERELYAQYDAEKDERAQIVERLKTKFSKLDFVIGGAVSIDIFRTGNDKSQVIERYFEEALDSNRMVFVGDRIAFPGNDFSIATALRQHPNGEAYEVESWEDTEKLLKTLPFA